MADDTGAITVAKKPPCDNCGAESLVVMTRATFAGGKIILLCETCVRAAAALIPGKQEGLSFDEALAEMRKQVGTLGDPREAMAKIGEWEGREREGERLALGWLNDWAAHAADPSEVVRRVRRWADKAERIAGTTERPRAPTFKQAAEQMTLALHALNDPAEAVRAARKWAEGVTLMPARVEHPEPRGWRQPTLCVDSTWWSNVGRT